MHEDEVIPWGSWFQALCGQNALIHSPSSTSSEMMTKEIKHHMLPTMKKEWKW